MQNEILVKKNANLDDTINLIVSRVAVDCNSEFVNVLCQKLNSTDPNRLAFLKRLFDRVHGTVKFQLDPEGRERVFRPERTIADGIGDCKKMTVIICSVLRRCGIPCLIKHVFYHTGNMTHVYTIVPYPCAKGYLAIDPVENKIFDNEVQYKEARIFDLNGNRMDLYTGARNKKSTFISSFSAATAGIWDDVSASAGCPVGATQKESAVLDSILSADPVAISGMGKRKSKVERQQKKATKKVDRKEKRKVVANKFKKVGLAAPRLAFLGLVRINAMKLATRLVLAWKKDKAHVENMWKNLGGDIKQLKATIIKGSKQQIAGREPEKMGVVALATAAAAAAPVLIAVHAMLQKLNVKGFTEQDQEKFDNFVENAEDKAADVNTKVQDIVDAAKGTDQEDIPQGNDIPEKIPPPADQQQTVPERSRSEEMKALQERRAAEQQQETAPEETQTAPVSGGFGFQEFNFINAHPVVYVNLIVKTLLYSYAFTEATKLIIRQITNHYF